MLRSLLSKIFGFLQPAQPPFGAARLDATSDFVMFVPPVPEEASGSSMGSAPVDLPLPPLKLDDKIDIPPYIWSPVDIDTFSKKNSFKVSIRWNISRGVFL